MASKNKAEKAAYERAKDLRDEFLKQLEKCDSESSLNKLSKKYKSDKFAVGRALTTHHAAEIQKLNDQITHLFVVKTAKLIPVVDASLTASPQMVVTVENEDGVETTVDSSFVESAVLDTVVEPETTKTAVETVTASAEVETGKTALSTDLATGTKHDSSANKNAHTCNPCSSIDVLDETGVNPSREKHLIKVRDQIEIIRKKAHLLNMEYVKNILIDPVASEKYEAAYKAAYRVADKAEALTNDYAMDKMNLNDFKARAKDIFKSEDSDIKILNTHRGWGQILANVLAAFVGNIFYLAAAAYTGSLLVFKPNTDSKNKVDTLADVVKQVKEEEEDLETLAPSM